MVGPIPEPLRRSGEQEGVPSASSDDAVRIAELESEVARLRAQVADRDDRLHAIQTISRAVGETRSLDEVLNLVMDRTTYLMNAERATLFLIDDETNELVSRFVQGPRIEEIRLEVGEGIAGWVAQSGKSVNIKDAYRDPRFQRNVDVETGFQTRSCLCQPIRNQDRKIIGVMQVLNKRDGYFTVEDEALLSAIASQAAVSIEVTTLFNEALATNIELRESRAELQQKNYELDLLYEIEREAAHAPDLDTLLASVGEKCLEALGSRASAITLRRDDSIKLHAIHRNDGDDYQFSVTSLDTSQGDDHGVGIEVASNARPFLCNAGCENIDNPVLDRLGISTRSVIAVPLIADDEVIGTLEVLNKTGIDEHGQPRGFDDDDLRLLTLIGSHVASAVATQLHRERREKAQRLSSIGQMVSSVLHDLKTPFSIISGFVQLMAREDKPEKREQYASSILKQFDTLNRMTKEILAFARGESTILIRKVFLNKFMDEVEQMLRGELAGRGIELEVEANYRGTARVDEVKLKRVFANLARNAIDAMPDGGHVAIRVDRHGDTLHFEFEDDGPGIPPEIQGRLFESFVSRGKKSGTGLGLAIVKKIVDEHGGKITYETTVDEGTRFLIDLPIDGDESEASAALPG